MATNLPPIQPYAKFIDANGQLTKDAYEFLHNLSRIVQELKDNGVIA